MIVYLRIWSMDPPSCRSLFAVSLFSFRFWHWRIRKIPRWVMLLILLKFLLFTEFTDIGQSPVLKFIQLYTSESYNDFHSLLVQPDEHHSSDEEKHRFSPIICRHEVSSIIVSIPINIFRLVLQGCLWWRTNCMG